MTIGQLVFLILNPKLFPETLYAISSAIFLLLKWGYLYWLYRSSQSAARFGNIRVNKSAPTLARFL
jgi:hypothetical protein